MAARDDDEPMDDVEVIPASDQEMDDKAAATKLKTARKDVESDDESKADEEKDEDEDTESEYEIESILDAKMGYFQPRKWGYLVSWKGYDSTHNSWVSEEDAGNAQELIDEYWKTRPKKTQNKGARKSTGTSSSAGAKATSAAAKTDRRKSNLSKAITPDDEDSDVEEVEKPAAPKKRGRASKSAPAKKADSEEEEEEIIVKPAAKKTRLNGNGAAAKAPAKAEKKKSTPSPAEPSPDYEPPPESMGKWMKIPNWEDLVEEVDTIERMENGDLRVFMTMTGGIKTAADATICNQRCPQKIIQFYQQHLRWREH